MDTDNKSWAYESGTLCWARRKVQQQSSGNRSIGNSVPADELWWPTILYPSWAEAASSGFMASNEVGVFIKGCKKRIAVEHLAKNMVPAKAVVFVKRNSPDGSARPKRRAVAHFLGLDLHRSSVPNWAAISVDIIMRYSANAPQVFSLYRDKLHPTIWKSFLTAMEEASMALENSSLSPKAISCSLDDVPQQTPEFFDDWKSGGESQSQSQKLTQFSQAVNYPIAKEKKEELSKCTKDVNASKGGIIAAPLNKDENEITFIDNNAKETNEAPKKNVRWSQDEEGQAHVVHKPIAPPHSGSMKKSQAKVATVDIAKSSGSKATSHKSDGTEIASRENAKISSLPANASECTPPPKPVQAKVTPLNPVSTSQIKTELSSHGTPVKLENKSTAENSDLNQDSAVTSETKVNAGDVTMTSVNESTSHQNDGIEMASKENAKKSSLPANASERTPPPKTVPVKVTPPVPSKRTDTDILPGSPVPREGKSPAESLDLNNESSLASDTFLLTQ